MRNDVSMHATEILFPHDAVEQADRLTASFIGMTTSLNTESFGAEVDAVMVELGNVRVGEDEWSTPEPAYVFGQTRALVASFAGIASFAAAKAGYLQRVIDADGEDVDLEDLNAARVAEVDVLRHATEMLHEIRRTHFYKRADPGE
jgi:hypothetical protein